jgi:nucleoside-diphosphate-sugar epimerase
MRFLILGGTRFIGPWIVRRLVEQGHSVAVFHRGQSQADLPQSVQHVLGDRKNLPDFAADFHRFAPQVAIDTRAFTEADTAGAVQAFRGLARRLVVLSSMDVYRAYDRLRRVETGPPDPTPATEDAPLRQTRYPYRSHAKGPEDFAFHYEKLLVEETVCGQPDLPATILRLPCVYGPGDYQHRTFEYLKRMDDGRLFILLDEQRAAWRWSRGYVENVAAAIVQAAVDDRATGKIYNIGEAQAVTEAEWVRRIGRAAGWLGEVRLAPKDRLPLHLRQPLDWRHDMVGDTSHFRRELGYREPVSLEEGLARTVAWERAHPPDPLDPMRFDYAAEDAILSS